MKLSSFFLHTLKESPKEASIQSHILMLRASLIAKQGSGIYSYLPLGLRVFNKVRKLLIKEIERTGAQEIASSHLVLKTLWDETGRYDQMGSGIFKLNDRHSVPYLLAPTHEESLVDIVRTFARSYRDFPMNLFQVGKKFRDEIRPRYGVMRGREFTMMDGYSFHTNEADLDAIYKEYSKAYERFYHLCGLKTLSVTADSGAMGGKASEEFMVESSIGDDTVFVCSECDYRANIEKAEALLKPYVGDSSAIKEKIYTPNLKTIQQVSEFLKVSFKTMTKSMVFQKNDGSLVLALVAGDRQVSEAKLSVLVGETLLEAKAEAIEKSLGPLGFLGPIEMKNPENITVVMDESLKEAQSFIVGANEKDYHFKGVPLSDISYHLSGSISEVLEGDTCKSCQKGTLRSFQGIEVGHIFKLGDFYSKSMNLNYLDEDGKSKSPLMGCYGLGVDRTLAAIIEQNHDASGIIFPFHVAPYEIILLVLDEECLSDANLLYEDLKTKGHDVLLDDRRTVRAGAKFKDADLIGIPIRLTMGKKYQTDKRIGFKLRASAEETFYSKESLMSQIKETVDAFNSI